MCDVHSGSNESSEVRLSRVQVHKKIEDRAKMVAWSFYVV
jgi:hypothetical protein